uniref:FAD-dependent oxidoreductase n=1 Tax=Treponema sp. TaxID=166 RepID=UPI0038905042
MKYIKFLAFAVIISLFVSCSKEISLTDGVFTGKGEGRNGEVEVEITVKDGKIFDAKIVKESETPEIALPAEELILKQFITSGSTEEIDVVSGATLTSNAVLDALDEAISQAQNKVIKTVSYKDTECDIVIIGAGGAGLVAATEAASKGADVIVLEKMGTAGGNAVSSTGGINASYTKEQQRLGIKDSPEVFYEDTMRGGKNLNDPVLVRTLVDNSAAMVEWLQSPLVGADLSDVGMFGGATNKRIHRPEGGGAIGAHLIPLLQKAALQQGSQIRFKNRVTDILSDKAGNKACGVRVSTENG